MKESQRKKMEAILKQQVSRNSQIFSSSRSKLSDIRLSQEKSSNQIFDIRGKKVSSVYLSTQRMTTESKKENRRPKFEKSTSP